jgi:hypothetical protein
MGETEENGVNAELEHLSIFQKHVYMFSRSISSYLQGVNFDFFILFRPFFKLFSCYEHLPLRTQQKSGPSHCLSFCFDFKTFSRGPS